MTTVAPTAPDLESMTFDALQKELKGIPAQRQAAINRADPQQLRATKAREAAIKEQLLCIRLANLKAEVERCEASLQAAYAAQKIAVEASAKAMAAATADHVKAVAAVKDAERRHGLGIVQQDHARANVEAAQTRLREACRLQTEAMTELDAI